MNKLKQLLTNPLAWGLIAFVVLVTLLAPWAYPENSTAVLANILGVWKTNDPVTHPLTVLIVRALSPLFPAKHLVFSANLFTAAVAAFCVTLFTLFVRNTFRHLTREPRTRPYLEKAEMCCVPIAACALLLSPIFLRASTHFTFQIFDLFFILSAALLTLRVAETGSSARMAVASFLTGLLLLESPTTLLVFPLLIAGILYGYISANDHLRPAPFIRSFALPLVSGIILCLLTLGGLNYGLDPSHSFATSMIVAVKRLLLNLLPFIGLPWILITFSGILPGIFHALLTADICKNKRSFVILFVLITLLVIAFCAFLPTPLAITALTEKVSGVYPVFLAVLTAFALANSYGCTALLHSVKLTAESTHERAGIRKLGRRLAFCLLYLTPTVLICGGLYQTVTHLHADAQLARQPRQYVDTILDNMDKATWLLSDGTADALLALRIAERDLSVTLLSLTHNNQEEKLESLRKLVETEYPFAGKPELQALLNRSLDIGLIPFIQDWMRADKSALDHFVTLALPDLWFTGDLFPRPDCLWYRGAPDRETLLRNLPTAGAQELFPSEIITPADKTNTSLKHFATYLRRQVGFISNNLAFFLADTDKKEEAFTLFEETYAYDPDNVSALFNIFELIHAGMHEEKKDWCENEIQELIKNLSGRRYRLWSLARTYGYIRSPQLISALAGTWAMSGQTGAAISGMSLALEMVEDAQRTILQNSIAALYTMSPEKRKDAIALYKSMLRKSTNTKQNLTYLRELIRMSIMEKDFQGAESHLLQAEAIVGKAEMGYERALYASALGNTTQARISLQSFLELHPKHIDALAMLATLQMAMNEIDAVKTTTLPKLLTAAGTEDNYFVQIILARLAEASADLKKARTSYLRALALKPEVSILRTTILTLDIRLNDRVAAEQHAKRFLYQDRKLPLANYIMGAIALQNEDLKRAESYLLIATDRSVTPPLPEAFNDLAETYRRQGEWASALATAQQAYTYEPKLACAHETAAAALLEMGRYTEAEEELNAALKIDTENNPEGDRDPSILLTRARLQEKQSQPELARVTLSTLQKQYDKLPKQGKALFDELAERVKLVR